MSLRPAVFAILSLFACSDSIRVQSKPTDQNAILDRAEARLREIYERGRFRGRRFNGEWLPDSSGYILREGRSGGSQRVIRVDVRTGEQTEWRQPKRGDRRRPRLRSPSGEHVLQYRSGDLYAKATSVDSAKRLTRTARPGEVRIGRPSWSSDSSKVLFFETDSSRVRKRARLEPSDPTYPKVQENRFARVGGTIPSLRIGVASVADGSMDWLPLAQPPEGHYLGQVEWAGNSREVLVERLSRFRDRREFWLFDLEKSTAKRIFEESDPAWVVASYGLNSGLVWLDDGAKFLVIHERDGWRHAYIHARDGSNPKLLTPGAFDIIERAGVDHEGGWFYFYASPDDAAHRFLYRVPLDGTAQPARMTPADQPGTHEYRFSPDYRWAFHTRSRLDEPPRTQLVELPSHRVVRALESNTALRQRLEQRNLRSTEFVRLPIAKDVTLDAWLMKPPDFDPTKKYPVLVYVYSEPHAQTVLDRWGAVHADYHRLVSDLGYLVVSMDSRGTPAPKGAAWRRAVFGSLGPLSTREQAAGLRTLAKTHPYVDLSRVGIWGWSGGGSNTLNAMFREPDLYRVGIAVAAKPQPHLYNAWFQEIYMRTREVNPEGYQRSAPIHFAEGLRGDLLIVHGTGEYNTHIQITEGLVDRLIELGKRFDYMTYPNRRHGIREGRGTSVHLRSLMIRYLLDHLPAGAR